MRRRWWSGIRRMPLRTSPWLMSCATEECWRNPGTSATPPCPWTRGTISCVRVRPPSTNLATTIGQWFFSNSTLDRFGSPATSCAISYVLATWREPGKHLRNWAMTPETRSSRIVSTTRRREMWTRSPGSLRRRFWPVPTPRTGTWLYPPSPSVGRRTSLCICSKAPSRGIIAPTMPCRPIPCLRACEVRRSLLSYSPPRNSAGTISWRRDRKRRTELKDSELKDRGLGLPSGEGHIEHSLPVRSSQARIEFLMLSFPISTADFDRIAGFEPIKSEFRQFILCALLSAHKTLQVGFDG